MTKFEFEKRKPEKIIEQTTENEAQKIKRLIVRQNFKIDDCVEKHLEKSVLDAREKSGGAIENSDILRTALKMLYQEQGALSETLEKEYIRLIAEEVTKIVANGSELHQALGEEIVKLKREGINIDGKQVEERMKEINASQEADNN